MNAPTVKNCDARDDRAVVVAWQSVRWGVWLSDTLRSFDRIRVARESGPPRDFDGGVLGSRRRVRFAVGAPGTHTEYRCGESDGGPVEVGPGVPFVWVIDGAAEGEAVSVNFVASRVVRETSGTWRPTDGEDPDRAPIRRYPRQVQVVVVRGLPEDARTVFTVHRVRPGGVRGLVFAHVLLGGEAVDYQRGFNADSVITRVPLTGPLNDRLREYEWETIERLRARGPGYWIDSGDEELADWFLPEGDSLAWGTDPPTPCTVSFFERGRT